MYKSITFLYLICFGCYIWFSRQPDYFDGETTTATIYLPKSTSDTVPPQAVFTIGNTTYRCNAAYPLRPLQDGQRVTVIYELSQPQKAAIYSWWGYWLTIGELLFSIVAYAALFWVAIGITSNPSPEALIEQLEYQPTKKTKYDEQKFH